MLTYRRILSGIACSLLALALSAGAGADEPPAHVRGTLASVEGDTLAVETDEEEMVEVSLKEDTRVLTVTPAQLEDIEQGDYVGITSVESGNERMALGLHIFAEDLRGTAEGHFAWDLVQEPNTMTNATVAEVEEVGADRQLTLTYAEKDGEQASEGTQTIRVPEFLDVVRLAKAPDRSVLTPGQSVFLIVQDVDGTPTAVAAVVGSEGANPPM